MYTIMIVLAAAFVSGCASAPAPQPTIVTADQCRPICGFDGVVSAQVENQSGSSKVSCICNHGGGK